MEKRSYTNRKAHLKTLSKTNFEVYALVHMHIISSSASCCLGKQSRLIGFASERVRNFQSMVQEEEEEMEEVVGYSMLFVLHGQDQTARE